MEGLLSCGRTAGAPIRSPNAQTLFAGCAEADTLARHGSAYGPCAGAGPTDVTAPQHIAVLDDEADITQLLADYLQGHGFRVSQLHSGRSLMEMMASDTPALVLLDLGLPGEDGFTIARQLREHWRCGLVIVTGRGDAVDKVVGLEVGADDYVTKPFDLRELLARIKAVLRRLAPAEPSSGAGGIRRNAQQLRFADWELDTAARRLTDPQGQDVALTGGEFDLLCAFARHAGRVLSRDFLLEQTRGREAVPSTARSTCRWVACARNWKSTRKIRRSSSRCAAPATSSCRRSRPTETMRPVTVGRGQLPAAFGIDERASFVHCSPPIPTRCCSSTRQARSCWPTLRRPILLGYAVDELAGLKVDALVPDSIRPRHAAYREAYGTRRRGRGRWARRWSSWPSARTAAR